MQSFITSPLLFDFFVLTLCPQFVEEQAIDRVHRLNQTVDVKIYKMTVKDTVEARILNLQERKRELANATIEGKSAATKLTMKDMLDLFRHDAETKFDDRSMDFAAKTRLLDSNSSDDRNDKENRSAASGPASVSASSSFSGQGQRASPPVMESSVKANRSVQENSVYGRRW